MKRLAPLHPRHAISFEDGAVRFDVLLGDDGDRHRDGLLDRAAAVDQLQVRPWRIV